ncbi:MAG: Uma2 family endonuclease [Deltaproteobacteria bacterium]|nr:Uma2 family endonuclease [Deltaproteobacteria bacterium]
MSSKPRDPVRPEPAWDVALLFPEQGAWSEEEYLALKGNRLVEFSHGNVEVLSMPTDSHQARVAAFFAALTALVSAQALGTVRFAPLNLRLWPGKFRQPDVLYLAAKHDAKRKEEFWEGADIVMEVVSPDDRRRDLVTKRREYAQAGIPEYWVVDPTEGAIEVLALEGDSYVLHGRFGRGQVATSRVLAGFSVEVAGILDAR